MSYPINSHVYVYALALLLLAPVTACGKGNDETPAGKRANDPGSPPGSASSQPALGESRAGSKADSQAHRAIERYVDVESAAITFTYSGWQQGTVTAYIGDYGNTVVMVYDLAKPAPEKKTIIWRDGKNTLWSVGTNEKTVYISSLRARDTELRLVRTRDPRQLQLAGYVKKANETVAGKDCEVWYSERQNVTLWRWQGIDLKYVNGALSDKSTYTVEATSVESPAVLPAELFEYPEGYQIDDRTQKR